MSVCPSVTLAYRGRIGWNSSKIILRLVSLGCSLSLHTPTSRSYPKGTPRNFDRNRGGPGGAWKRGLSAYKSCNISETGQDRTKVAIEDQKEVIYAFSIGAKINDLG